jgi:hypothetical protein
MCIVYNIGSVRNRYLRRYAYIIHYYITYRYNLLYGIYMRTAAVLFSSYEGIYAIMNAHKSRRISLY